MSSTFCQMTGMRHICARPLLLITLNDRPIERNNILPKLRIYFSHNDIHLQWIPSHVDLFFNDLADELAKEGSSEPLDNRGLLTYCEIFSKVRADNNRT
ncbi:hypothetical protein AVEN_10541-1 [Araneus ventricosus]|uniref:Uncharacterized protein n=1 Tax=Araneus ventricosus TaxID=182803 RepID=A0A4Y2G883_ARAVE|nr:hypothetical protein AVEN_10541-1 [Araneus ventricosus]